MKRTLTTLSLVLLAASASASTSPHPTAIDADGDGFWTATMDVNGDTNVDHLDIGIDASDLDCDDGHASINPGADDDTTDGIDQDCSGSDFALPSGWAEAEFDRFLANSGVSDPSDAVIFIARCTGNASVDKVLGTCIAADGYQVIDLISGTLPASREFSAVFMKADGIPDILSDSEVAYVQKHAASTSARSGNGYGKKAITAIATEQAEAATGQLREEMLVADAALSERIDYEASSRIAADEWLLEEIRDVDESAGAAYVSLASEMDAEVARLDGRIDETNDNVVNVARVAYNNQAHGPLFEAYGMGNVVLGSAVSDGGTVVRDSVGGGGGMGFNFGLDAMDYRFNGYAQGAYGRDGSDLSFNLAAGAERLWDLGAVELGLNAGYLHRSSFCTALDKSALGRMPNAGATLVVPFNNGSNGSHGLFLVRASAGPEWVSRVGDKVSTDVRFGGLVTVGLGIGNGALR